MFQPKPLLTRMKFLLQAVSQTKTSRCCRITSIDLYLLLLFGWVTSGATLVMLLYKWKNLRAGAKHGMKIPEDEEPTDDGDRQDPDAQDVTAESTAQER